MKRYLVILFTLFVCGANAQNIALKTNLLYDATKTINLGVEIGLGKRTTLDISGNYNAWDYNDANEKMRHMLIQPEFRYYFCEKMSGHFIGVHAHMLQYNVCGDQWLMSAFQTASNLNGVSEEMSRYQGDGYGGGLVYGYNWAISNRFNIEFAVGGGYVFMDYDRYGPDKCDPLWESGIRNYWGLTKLGISLVYIIK